jgi:hypothetical protein
LLGHALLIVEQKNKADLFKVHQRPIPLELLVIATDVTGLRPIVSYARLQPKRRLPPTAVPLILSVKFEGGERRASR